MLGRDAPEVGVVHERAEGVLGPGLVGEDHRRVGRRVEHAEDPDREQARLASPGLVASVRDAVLRLEADGTRTRHRVELEPEPVQGIVQQADRPHRVEGEPRPGVVDQLHRPDEARVGFARLLDVPAAPVDGLGGLPVLEVEGVALREEDRELPALGTQPEAVLASEDVDVGLSRARGDGVPVEPAVARAVEPARGARHDAPLIGRNDRDPGVAGLEQDHLGVLAQEREIVAEARSGVGCVLHGRRRLLALRRARATGGRRGGDCCDRGSELHSTTAVSFSVTLPSVFSESVTLSPASSGRFRSTSRRCIPSAAMETAP